MKRHQIAVIALAAFLSACSRPPSVRLLIGSGATDGVYYGQAEALASAWRTDIPDLSAEPKATYSDMANARLLAEGKANVIFIRSDIAYYAENGLEMFGGRPVRGLLGMTALYPEACQLVTRADAGIAKVADLRGRNVAVGVTGTGAEACARRILEAAGLGYGDLHAVFRSFGDAAGALAKGQVDAAFLVDSLPSTALQELAAQSDVRLVPLGYDLIEGLVAKYPYYTAMTIPSDTYDGLAATTPTIGAVTMLAVSPKLESETVEMMLKVLYDTIDRLDAGRPRIGGLAGEAALKAISLPLHPGAERYFGAAGK